MKNIKKLIWESSLSMRGYTLKNLQHLKKWQWLDHFEMLTLQQQLLKQLLLHAKKNVPYYQKVLPQAGVVNGRNLVNLNGFEQIPLLNKDIIRSNFENLKSSYLNHRNCHENSSGGSTGEPVRLIQDRYYRDWVLAIKMLDDLWSGYLSGEKKMLLWGSERDLLVNRETLKFRLSKWLRNEIWLNAFRMTSDKMRDYVKQINTFRPVQILAYAESIYELARFIDRDGLKLDYRPQAIMTSAGTMDSHKREIIERVFRAPVFNRYGSREVGDIACECECHKGLHVHAPTHYVEILRPDGSPTEPGETGEIVVTSLINHAMPLIRYRIGDIGAWADEPCVCGRNWPLLKEVTGRTSDYFILKNGDRFRLPTFWFTTYNWIKKYQVIQEDYKLITVIIVPLRSSTYPHQQYRSSLMVLTRNIKEALGQDCNVQFDFVREIAPTASGKFCYTLSKVAKL